MIVLIKYYLFIIKKLKKLQVPTNWSLIIEIMNANKMPYKRASVIFLINMKSNQIYLNEYFNLLSKN
jgi:hypothetical protein